MAKASTASKPAATAQAASTTTNESKAQVSTVVDGLDLAKLTPAQLSALQKQLKEKSKVVLGKKDERFAIIDRMLAEKKDGQFVNTTRNILDALLAYNLVDTTPEDYDQIEIKKIQARKQHLEKKTDEKAQLVYPVGTFGYKASEGGAFQLGAVRIVKWLNTPENIKTLTPDDKASIIAALK